jgi:protein SCO1/2
LPLAVAALAAALGVAASLYLDTRVDRPPEIRGYVLAEPRPLPDVQLIDERGATFRTDNLRGHWSLLYFGYTYCPDVCPLTLVQLANLERHLEAERATAIVEYYLVSVDPRRDTPARLREYVAYFDPEFHGLTGAPEALAELAAATETVFDVPEDPDGDNYLVSHSSNVVLLDPSARVHAVFTPPHEPATLAADFTKVAARYDASR